jgi:hypothetical protein
MANYNIIIPKKRTGQITALLQGKFGEVWRTIGTSNLSFWELFGKLRSVQVDVKEQELGWILLRLIEENLVTMQPNSPCECEICE